MAYLNLQVRRTFMQEFRAIARVVTGRETTDGAGVRLVRVFGNRDVVDFDPFLMMDAFDNTKPEQYVKGFPWHPHRGIETITYLIEGNIEHGDSLGNKGNIYNGDCQWMTAGSGIIHQEMPQPPGKMLGVQIWLNLPAKDKMTKPAYGDIVAANVPVIDDQGCEVRLIAGKHKGKNGAFTGCYIKPLFMDVKVPPHKTWELNTVAEHTLYTYTFYGSGSFEADAKHEHGGKVTLLFKPGEKLRVTAGSDELRFIVLSAPPLKEPVAWGGPVVMNTQAELDLAFSEMDAGTFIKK